MVNTKWSDFLQSWKLANLLGYPFTDNGSMLESIMQFFFPKKKVQAYSWTLTGIDAAYLQTGRVSCVKRGASLYSQLK